MDKYLVEFVDYAFHWIDVGPGPAMRGGVIGIESIHRGYHRAHNNLEEVQKVIEDGLDEEYGFFIVSKLIGRVYVPGKLHIDSFGKAMWTKVDNFKWVRLDHSWPAFRLECLSDRAYYGSQRIFYEKSKTFAELCASIAHRLKPAIVESMDRHLRETSILQIGGNYGTR